jgi:formate--tetrahydrofolate ligase
MLRVAFTEDVALVEAGCANLERHVKNTRLYGVPVVVGVNAFASDTQAELEVCEADSTPH